MIALLVQDWVGPRATMSVKSDNKRFRAVHITEHKKALLVVALAVVLALAAAVVLEIPSLRPGPLPLRTKVVLQIRQLYWNSTMAELGPLHEEGIERAERINEQILRRYHELWRRSLEPSAPEPRALPPIAPAIVEERK